MRHGLLLKLTASALALTPVAVAIAADLPAAKHAARAEQALAKQKLAAAMASAEAAVAVAPRDADYRMLLGRVYLQAGRYRSAAASFADVLALDATRGSAALSLALTRIGLGDQAAARTILDSHGARIAAGDRGLALALAGDPEAGIAILEPDVRSGGSDAKTRQNLALAYGLAGRWPEAKLMASYDLDPLTLSQRIMEWSRFTREGQASAQVAALLGVAPGPDDGQPARLALTDVAPTVQLAQAPPPPVALAPAEPVARPEAVVETVEFIAPGIRFAPRAEVVQAIAVSSAASPRPTVATPAVQVREADYALPTGGRFVVQLGAFDSAGVAEAAWQRMSQRIGVLRAVGPSSATVIRGAVTFHRLSVSGFATRTVAVRFCETLRRQGGPCFVRETAGDLPLQWVKRPQSVRIAAR